MLVSTLKHALTVCHVAEVMSGKSGSVPELKTFFGLTLNTGYVKKPNLELVSFCPDWSSLSERWVLSGTKFFFSMMILIVLFSGVSGDHSGRPKVEGQWFNLLHLQCQTVFRQDVDDQVAPSLFLLICLKLWFLEWSKWTNLLNWLSFCFEVQIERSRRVFPGCNGRVVKALDLKSNGDFPT